MDNRNRDESTPQPSGGRFPGIDLFRRTRPRRSTRRRLAAEALEDRRLLSAGGLDSTFHGDGYQVITPPSDGTGSVTATAMVLQTVVNGSQQQQKILLVGYETPSGGDSNSQAIVIRLNSDGSLDTTFNETGIELVDFSSLGYSSSQADAVTIDPKTGDIVVAGSATSGSDTEFAVAWLQANGSADSYFGTNGLTVFPVGNPDSNGNYSDTAYAVAVDANGNNDNVVLAGSAQRADTTGTTSLAVARTDSRGNQDMSFNSGQGWYTANVDSSDTDTSDAAYAMAISGGDVYLAGTTQPYSGAPKEMEVLALHTDGSPDNDFNSGSGALALANPINPNADYYASSLAISPVGGKIVLGGFLDLGNGEDWTYAVAQLNGDGSPDMTFNNGGGPTVLNFGRGATIVENPSLTGQFNGGNPALAVDSSGRIVVAGSLQPTYGALSAIAVDRLDSDGSPDANFGNDGQAILTTVNPGHNNYGTAVQVQSDGQIVVAGDDDYTPTNFVVARLNGTNANPTQGSGSAGSQGSGSTGSQGSGSTGSKPVALTPAVVTGVMPSYSRRGLTAVTVTFNEAIQSALAQNPFNYLVHTVGRGRRFHPRTAQVKGASYNPATNQVTLTLARPFRPPAGSIQLVVHGAGILARNGAGMVGSSGPASDYVAGL
jgi:uncharacterized delta-60 repeat protein